MFTLTRSQEIVWLHEQLFPDSPAYNFTAVLDLRGRLDEHALRRSLDTVLHRHDGLRLELATDEVPPQQRINPDCAARYRTRDLSTEAEPEQAFERLLLDHHETPFQLTEAPLARWCLVRLGELHHRLVHTEHHLIHDGWSFGLILRDLFTLYRSLVHGVPAELPPPRSYADSARESAARSESHRDAVEYWRSALAGAEFGLPLRRQAGLDHDRHAPAGAQLRQTVDADQADALRTTARRHGHTPYSVLLTLYAEMLRRLTGQADLVIGSAVGNRPPGCEETVGMFVNTIPLRISPRPEKPASDAVDETTDTLLRGLPHQHVPVQDLTHELGLHSRTGLDTPIFDVLFSAHDAPLPTVEGLDLDVSILEGFNSGTSRFDLDVVLLPDSRRTVNPSSEPAGMVLVWDYASDLFGRSDVENLQRRFAALLRDYLHDPSAPLNDLAPTATDVTGREPSR